MYLDALQRHLSGLEREGRRRRLRDEPARAIYDFSSNDYLGLRCNPQIVAALNDARVVGSSGARLLSGAAPEHARLEAALAEYTGRERALLFSSGYLAAIGTITALAPHFDCVYSDAGNHASLIDGVRLSKRERVVYPHLELGALARDHRRKLVVSESLFSMDGDQADPVALLDALCPRDALLIDEAHVFGLVGPQGAGSFAGFADPRLIVFGTLSKALGANGGFVAGPATLVDYLQNTARTFIFDTAPPPAISAAATVAISLARAADEARARLHAVARYARAELVKAGFDIGASSSHIIPIIVGSDAAAVGLAARLLEHGILAPAIRPPTVPVGTARLRVTLNAAHAPSDIKALIEGLLACTTLAAFS